MKKTGKHWEERAGNQRQPGYRRGLRTELRGHQVLCQLGYFRARVDQENMEEKHAHNTTPSRNIVTSSKYRICQELGTFSGCGPHKVSLSLVKDWSIGSICLWLNFHPDMTEAFEEPQWANANTALNRTANRRESGPSPCTHWKHQLGKHLGTARRVGSMARHEMRLLTTLLRPPHEPTSCVELQRDQRG